MNMYLDLNLATFKYFDGFRCYHFCLYFDWNWLFSCELLRNFGSVLGLKIAVTFASVLGLQVNTGLQPPTCWEPFVSGTMLRRPEPTKEWAQPTILSNSGRNLDLNKIRFAPLHYSLQYSFWFGCESEKLKSFYWYLEKTQGHSMRPTATITICKYFIKPR